MADATATIAGNLTADPELRFTNDGTAIARFTVAVTERRRKGTGGWTATPATSAAASGRSSPNTPPSLCQRDRVVVTGRLKQRSWEAEGGEKRHTVEIDDLGPSLRWTTATVNRTARTGGDIS